MLACSMTGSLKIQTQANFLISESESCAGCQCTVSAESYADEKKQILFACNPPFLMGVLNSFEGAPRAPLTEESQLFCPHSTAASRARVHS